MRVLLGTLAVLFSMTNPAYSMVTKGCNQIEYDAILAARNFIFDHAQEVLTHVHQKNGKFLKRRFLRRYLRKVSRQDVKCERGSMCREFAGHSRGRLATQIRICPIHLNGNAFRSRVCSYVEVMSHEYAHAAGMRVRIIPHNQGRARNDLVYQTGYAFGELCDLNLAKGLR